MKFVKLLRPLFLVALGLHGLALFLPVGGASETAEIEAAEETRLAREAELSKTGDVPGQLPVPDPNVAAGGAIAGVAPILANRASAPAVAPTPAVQPAPTATRSAPLAVAVPGAAAARARPTAGGAGSSSTTSPTAPPSEPANSSPPLALPDIESADTSDRTDTVSANTTPANEDATDSSQISTQSGEDLIASAIKQLPDSLKALMDRWADALTYSQKGTSDRNAKAAQSEWTDKINSQASGTRLDRQVLEPEQIENFANVSYPIESSLRDREQSFRICLEQPPSTPAEIGILFDSQGEIVGELELIRSTGYKAINDEAIATVKTSKNLPDNRVSKAFIFEVTIDYEKESCTRLSDLKD